MKKYLFILGLVLICGRAWALPDNLVAKEYNADTSIKASSGYVYSVVVSFKGVTAGDWVKIYNALALTGGEKSQCTIVASGANSQGFCGPYTAGNYFDTGIYVGESLTGGTAYIDVQWQ